MVLSFNEVSLLEHVWGFQSWNFIEGFFCSGMFSCFKPEMLWFWSVQPTCDLMLIQPWIKVMYCSLFWLTLHIRTGIRISHVSIPRIVAQGRCYIPLFFFFNFLPAVALIAFLCSVCILQTRVNLTSFLF